MPFVYVSMPFEGDRRAQLEAALPGGDFFYCPAPEVDDGALTRADVVIGNVPPAKLALAQKLRFLQLNSAGSNDYAAPGVLPEGTALCNASGAYGLAISEHILAGVLTLIKKLHLYARNQQRHVWRSEGQVRSIFGSTFLIVGAGDIGGTLAAKAKALGACTVGVRRTARQKPAFLDEVYTMDALDDLLPRADVVVLSLPKTPETTHLMNAARLGRMKPDGILVNVGRGDCVVTEDLVAALQAGRIGGAVLDVTDPEPLPEDHPLWDCENLVLTPHVSGFYHLPATLYNIQSIAIRNLTAWGRGEGLENVVDFSTGYRKLPESEESPACQTGRVGV
ncbi:MAG: D-2-hydroxyacid dehydrogenase [Clostridiales bacterium]|nr:D-2-hydroxyacid dehydrogenase [Clostridiales bacterium]